MPRPGFTLPLVAALVGLGAGPVLPPDADPVLAVRANAAIAADPALAGLALTVDVVNRVAVVGGPVPDLALVPKIEAALAKVPGLLAVKVSGWVPAAADPLARRVADKLRKPSAPPPATAVRTAPELPPLALAPSLAPPRPDAPPPLVAARSVAPTVSSTSAASPRPAPALPPGVTVTRYAPPDLPREPGWLDPPVAPRPAGPVNGDTVSAAVARLLRTDARFRRLRADAAGGVVTVTGRVRASGDTFDFAAAARKLPGVTRVVVGRVAAD